GCHVNEDGLKKSIKGNQKLKGANIEVPGDISSAAFFLVAGAILPNSKIRIKNVGINPTRTGIIDILKLMGATLTVDNVNENAGEPYADIMVTTSNLRGVEISGDIIP